MLCHFKVRRKKIWIYRCHPVYYHYIKLNIKIQTEACHYNLQRAVLPDYVTMRGSTGRPVIDRCFFSLKPMSPPDTDRRLYCNPGIVLSLKVDGNEKRGGSGRR